MFNLGALKIREKKQNYIIKVYMYLQFSETKEEDKGIIKCKH